MTLPTAATRHPLPATLLRAIYWSTPLFVALDFMYGVSLRVPFLDALPGAKALYYGLELACAVVITARPAWAATIGLAESSLNIALLVLSTAAAYLAVLESAASPDAVIVNPFTPQAVTSLVLAASTLAASHILNVRPRTSG
ncbi:MAG: hypothetical protein M3303_09290 [Gemmatimonadota bacterium]|nr:hypothetical protein [Gemmatimonadota bacterium]